MKQVQILVVDDHPLVRVGLRTAILSAFPGAGVSEASTLSEAGREIASQLHDAVILDLTLPDSRGIMTFRAVRELCPATPIIVVTGEPPEALTRAPAMKEAAAILSKTTGPDAILGVLRLLVDPLAEGGMAKPNQPILTPREIDILALCALGLQNKMIGRSLGISENTVRAHLASVFKRHGLSNRSEVKALLEKAGICRPS